MQFLTSRPPDSALGAANDFIEEPGPVSGFIDPARCGYIVMLLADAVSSAQVLDQSIGVRKQLGKLGLWR